MFDVPPSLRAEDAVEDDFLGFPEERHGEVSTIRVGESTKWNDGPEKLGGHNKALVSIAKGLAKYDGKLVIVPGEAAVMRFSSNLLPTTEKLYRQNFMNEADKRALSACQLRPPLPSSDAARELLIASAPDQVAAPKLQLPIKRPDKKRPLTVAVPPVQHAGSFFPAARASSKLPDSPELLPPAKKRGVDPTSPESA